MDRIREEEWMDTPAEATTYDRMDHDEVNVLFVNDLFAALGSVDGVVRAIDLGTGTARIPIELCQRDKRIQVTAVDAAQSMLDLAEANVTAAHLRDQITLQLFDAKTLPESVGKFDVVMSNSLVHHLPKPRVFFEQAVRVVAPGGLLFTRDLLRPASDAELNHLVATYAVDADPEQRQMLADSLHAALTLDEIREFVSEQGYSPDDVHQTTDRHWTWCCRGYLP